MKFFYFVFILFFSVYVQDVYTFNHELIEQADALWTQRHITENFDKAVDLYEKLYDISSSNRHVLERLSFAYSTKGYYFAKTKQEQLDFLETS